MQASLEGVKFYETRVPVETHSLLSCSGSFSLRASRSAPTSWWPRRTAGWLAQWEELLQDPELQAGKPGIHGGEKVGTGLIGRR